MCVIFRALCLTAFLLACPAFRALGQTPTANQDKISDDPPTPSDDQVNHSNTPETPINNAETPSDKSATPPASAQPLPAFWDFSSPELSLKSVPRNLFRDQKDFWTLPFHMSKRDWQFTVPITFVSAALLASDSAIEGHVPNNPTTISHAVTASNAGLGALAGIGSGMFLWGQFEHNGQMRETGILSGEAGIDVLLEDTVFKYAFARQRPYESNGKGLFFHNGDSFPSDHAAVSFAIATVIANEYPGPLTRFFVYGLAVGVSAARIAGQKHFPTDVLAGDALGWYAGWQVFHSHSRYSNAEIARYGTFKKEIAGEEPNPFRAPQNMGASYVPIDNWVYPVFDRLIASGAISDRGASLRPWSRLECARLLSEAHHHIDELNDQTDDSLVRQVNDLDSEFAFETRLLTGDVPNVDAEFESMYTRYTQISGPPLRDSFHFAQTLADDFGRPYGRGANFISGVTTNATLGPFLLYVRGEYQHAAASADYTPAQAQDIGIADSLPANSVPTFGPVSRLRTIEAYAGLNIENWQLTFGQQSLWWGVNRSTSLLLSNNAEAMPMLRLERVSPMRLPTIFSFLGPLYVSAFLGRLGGVRYLALGPNFTLYGDGVHQVDPQPFIWGGAITFKPTRNLELQFAGTTVFAGHGRPLTLETFLHTFSQHGDFQPVDPGARRPTVSASYRLPHLRDTVTIYADSMALAQPTPLFYPQQSALNAGIYAVHLPRLNKVDFRCEGVYTNIPGNSTNNAFYRNDHYPTGYRNYGQIIGSWIGRTGSGGQASTTYWFTGRNKATLTYRRMITGPSLLKGGNVHDASASLGWTLPHDVEIDALFQYERWRFAELNPLPQNNVSAALQIQVWPRIHTNPITH